MAPGRTRGAGRKDPPAPKAPGARTMLVMAEEEEKAEAKADEADASAAGAARGKEAVAGRAAARKSNPLFFLSTVVPGR